MKGLVMVTPHHESYRAEVDGTSASFSDTKDLGSARWKVSDVNNEIIRTLGILFDADQVVELRALKGRETVSGYFDDREALLRKARDLDGSGYAVYITLNEVHPALLSRAASRARKIYRESTTSDRDIVRRRWLALDFDPARPAGVSSTAEEKSAALLRAREVRDHLRAKGWPEPVVGDSGNGAHLLYRVDLPNDAESLDLVKRVLSSLDFMFSDNVVCVDTGVANAARIWKLYGTTARKGGSTQDRPHRRSRLLRVPGAISKATLAEVPAWK